MQKNYYKQLFNQQKNKHILSANYENINQIYIH